MAHRRRKPRIIKEVDRLAKAYQRSKGLGRLSQLGGAAAHALTVGKIANVFGADLAPGFTRIKTEMNAYKGKLGHLNEHAERLGGQLSKLLDTINDYCAEHGVRHGADMSFPKLTQLQDKVNMLLVGGVSGKRHGFRGALTISEAWERCQKGTNALRDVEMKLAALNEQEEHASAIVIADRVITLLLNLGVALAGYNASLAVAGGTTGEVNQALRIDGPQAANGGAALGLGIFRQFMILFKDSHSLLEDLGVVTANPDGSKELLAEIIGDAEEIAAAPPPLARPRESNLVRALEARYAHRIAVRPPVPTRPVPHPPNSVVGSGKRYSTAPSSSVTPSRDTPRAPTRPPPPGWGLPLSPPRPK
ncbi:hypothetical protein ACMGDM_15470 [Sphingomonas sp. DT-51]|uniref:hypothetical protein n=1 Tax=Sphingomonas sp. DT-51 TaxID=3396165 RepID=UPI003F1E2076